jgi:hypothetical protein
MIVRIHRGTAIGAAADICLPRVTDGELWLSFK